MPPQNIPILVPPHPWLVNRVCFTTCRGDGKKYRYRCLFGKGESRGEGFEAMKYRLSLVPIITIILQFCAKDARSLVHYYVRTSWSKNFWIIFSEDIILGLFCFGDLGGEGRGDFFEHFFSILSAAVILFLGSVRTLDPQRFVVKTINGIINAIEIIRPFVYLREKNWNFRRSKL